MRGGCSPAGAARLRTRSASPSRRAGPRPALPRPVSPGRRPLSAAGSGSRPGRHRSPAPRALPPLPAGSPPSPWPGAQGIVPTKHIPDLPRRAKRVTGPGPVFGAQRGRKAWVTSLDNWNYDAQELAGGVGRINFTERDSVVVKSAGRESEGLSSFLGSAVHGVGFGPSRNLSYHLMKWEQWYLLHRAVP